MALGSLTLSTTTGIVGLPFSAKINGLTTGKVEVMPGSASGYWMSNGILHSDALPYDFSVVILREYDPGVGAGFLDTPITVSALGQGYLSGLGQSALLPGRSLVSVQAISFTLDDGSSFYMLKVADNLGDAFDIPIDTVSPDVSLDFVNGIYRAGGKPTTVEANLSTARNDTAYALGDDGLFHAFTAGQLRITSLGLFAGPAIVQNAKYANDLTNATWAAQTGATKATLTGTRGPFTRTQIVAATAARDSGVVASLISNLTAGQEYTFAFWYEPGTSGNFFIRVQQGFGSFQHSNVTGKIGDPSGAATSGAGTIYGVRSRRIAIDGFECWETSFTFVPSADGAHQLRVGPGSLTNGQDIVGLGVFQAAGRCMPEIVPSTTANVTRAADALTAIGPLAAALEADRGTVIVEFGDMANMAGDLIAGGAADAAKFLTSNGWNDLSAPMSAVTLPVHTAAADFTAGNSFSFSWDNRGRRAVWSDGEASLDATFPPSHAGIHLLSGVQAFIRKITVLPAASNLKAARSMSGWRSNKAAGVAGGFITGICISSNGTFLARADVHNAWRRRPGDSEWTPLITTTSMPAGDRDLLRNGGVSEIVSAPSNPQRIYMLKTLLSVASAPSYLYRSDDEGDHWTLLSAFAAVTDMSSNRTERLGGPFIAVDPANPDHVIVGTPGALRRSTDGGQTFAALAWAGTANSTGFGVVFDSSSAVVGGITQGVYVFKGGTGLYKSTDGGVSATTVAGGPTTFIRMAIGSDGTLYICPNTAASRNIYKLTGGDTFSTCDTNGGSGSAVPTSVAVDPVDPNRIAVVIGNSGQTSVSLDKGATWTGLTLFTMRAAPDVPWHLWTNETFLTSGHILFDDDGYLWLAEGIGVWRTKPGVPHNQAVVWEEYSAGIMELVANDIVSLPSGTTLTSSWDRPVFATRNFEAQARRHGLDNVNAIVHGWSLTGAPSDSSFAACLANTASVDRSGYTLNSGRTWSQFTNKPTAVATLASNFGGSIAASGDGTKLVVALSGNGPLVYTGDRGATAWSIPAVAGLATSGERGWGSSPYPKRQIVAASQVNDGTFYAYNYGGASTAGVYKIVNGVISRVYTGTLAGGTSSNNAKLKIKPGTADELFFSGGTGGTSTLAAPSAPGNTFQRATAGSDGATWTVIPNITEAWDFAWGKAAPDSAHPTLFILGYYKGVFGHWYSTDDAQSFQPLGGVGANYFPNGSLDNECCIEGDPNVFGRLHVGFQGSGFMVYDIGG